MVTPLYCSKLSGSKFKNWIKAGLGILFTKEGIEPFVYDEIEQFQQKSLSNICNNNGLPSGTTCSSCCTENVVFCPTSRICNARRGECKFHRDSATQYLPSGCPNKICDNLKKEIQKAHRFSGPSYKNTDATKWCSNPWEVAKCFMPSDGYENVTNAAETDFNGMISVIINYKAFQSKIHDDLYKQYNVFEQVREVGKAVRHSPQLEMEDTDLKQYFSDLQNLLSDPAYLSADIAAQNAKTKLLQLQSDTLVIGKDDIRNMLDDVAKAVQDKIRTEMNEHKKEAEKKKLELIKITNESVKAIDNQGKVSNAQLDNALKSAIDEIGKQTKESLKNVQAEADIAKKQIDECAGQGTNKLKVEAEAGVKQIKESADKGVNKLEVEAKAGVKYIEESIDKGVNKLEVEAVAGMKQIEESADKGVNKLEVEAEAGVKQIEESAGKGVNKLEVEAEAGVTKISAKTDEALKQIEELTTANKEDKYRKFKEDLKEDLIVLYRKRHHTLPLSPLLEKDDTPLLKFYVMPDINAVEIQRLRGAFREVKSKVTSLHDLFYKESEPCREIYLTADAGFGKTALSKRLVLTWCQAKQCIQNEEKYFEKEAISEMSEFEFVFLLSLRDSSRECDIDEMIIKQIIPWLANTSITISGLETILSKEKCLVILDGLDEWTHPAPTCKQGQSDIPHRKARECTILTTTRPWKLGISKIRSSEIEQKLELVGLSKTSAKSLKRSVISLLCGKSDIEKHIQDFDLAVSDRGISDLETNPLLLMYLLCLWCDGIELGTSRTELYCQIVELLLKRTFEKYLDIQQSCEQPQSDTPRCFSEHEHCKENYTFLKALGQLAFETLFSENKESTLVFSQIMTDKHLTPGYLKLSLYSGILTLSTEKTLTKHIRKFSFSHKTVQEFFCALYICCQSDVRTTFLKKCKSLQSILDMSTVFVFTSGMVNAEVISSISHELMSVISQDKITREYRSTTDGDCKPLKDIQDMYISCIKENPDKELNIFCQDFFCSNKFSHLTRQTIVNKKNIESINIKAFCSREIIDTCALGEPFNINKIYYYHNLFSATELCVLLNRLPKCVTVITDILHRGIWTRKMCEILQKNSQLQAICILNFEMSHDVLNDFLKYIINRITMTEIILLELSCTEHGRSCTFSLDFCQHSDLRKLDLSDIPKVSQLKVNSQVKHVKLKNINLGEMSLPPEMVDIERVELENVNLSASTFCDLVKELEKISNKVTVIIHRCKIEPETEFKLVKQYIHSSQNFRVAMGERGKFVFETKVEGK